MRVCERGVAVPVRSRTPPALRSSATRDRSAGRARRGRCKPRQPPPVSKPDRPGSSGRCRPRRSSSAARAGRSPRPGGPWPGTRRQAAVLARAVDRLSRWPRIGSAGWDELVGGGTVGPAMSCLTGEAQVRIGRLLGAVLAVSVMLGGLLLVTARPATACTCAQMTEAQLAARIDVLFVGTLVSSRVDPSVLTREYREERKRRERVNPSAIPEPDPVVLTFEVTRVYKGAVGKRQEIVICHPPVADKRVIETCGSYVPATPGPWLLFASQPSGDSMLQLDPGQYLSGFTRHCLGSRALADGGEPGRGGAPGVAVGSTSPTRGGPPVAAPSGPVSLPSPTRGGPPAGAPSGSDSSPSPTSLVVGVGVLAAGVSAGLGLAIRRARRRASAD